MIMVVDLMIQLQATGAEKPESIQELELIFADIHTIDSLQHCVSLRSLTCK